MCGISGFLASGEPWRNGRGREIIADMIGALAHRGPDHRGIWLQPEQHVALGHARLSVLDTSQGGHQPMTSANGRFVIVFNGEIYNHEELRSELETAGFQFRSRSDTEVLLEALAHWGVMAACRRLQGMFAFAAWDLQSRTLWLCRDRMGKKPLYLYRDGRGGTVFASEPKAFWQYPGFAPAIDPRALHEFFRFSYIPDDVSIFKGVDKIMPGTAMEITLGDTPIAHVYWQLSEVVTRQSHQRLHDQFEAEDTLLALLRDATRRRMLSDVPLGAFLSGGIDSGLVVSLMQEASISKVKTFSIGFLEADYDEAPAAKSVAHHLGTDHTEFYVSQAEAQQVIPELPMTFDEPFADASQIPTLLLSRLARSQVTVALTGDGGDESFGGYVRYRNEDGLIGSLFRAPGPVRRAVAGIISRVPSRTWDGIAAVIPASRRPRFISSKAAKFARAIVQDDAAERSKAFLSFWAPEEVLRDHACLLPNDPYAVPNCLLGEPSEMMQFWETKHYLSGDLLVKLDRASMAASLEARSPLLDHRVVEFAWKLPPSLKASPLGTKRILRALLGRYVPHEIVNLPKQGFSVPVGRWMVSGMRDWVESTLAYGRSHTQDLLHWPVIDRAWQAHLRGSNGYSEKLWIVLMFCAWHEHWFGTRHARQHAFEQDASRHAWRCA